MQHRLAWPLLSMALAFSACASTPRTTALSAPPAQTESTLGPGDTFEVTVYGEEDLSGKYRISEDGTINFPFVGRIQVADKSQSAIADLIQAALADKQILRKPLVSVFLLEQTSKHISVMGAVAKPGGQPLTSGMTIIDAISSAGGLTPIASGDNTIVTRRVEGKLQRYKVPVESITEGHTDDFQLQEGDIVFVPERIF
jgi:protein involved in polysaccharide export with SLBB domain